MIRFTPQSYRWAKRAIPADVESERALDDGRTEVTFYFENPEYVAKWVLRYGTDAEVLEPEVLRQKVRAQALAVAEQYEGVAV